MEILLNRFRNLTVLVVVIAAQLLLLAYQVKTSQDVSLLRIWVVTAVTPVAKGLEVVRQNTIGFVEDYLVLLQVREHNRQLTEEVGKLKLQNQFLSTQLQTADRVAALAAFQRETPSKTITARVIGSGTGVNSQAVFVDRGTKDGVEKGMAVVTPDGIVGKIIAAYPTASLVLKITDSTFAAGVVSQKNRIHGILKGRGQPTCLVDYVPNQDTVDQGEMFYTSGDDRIFPRGMPVGVARVVKPGTPFKDIIVEPAGLRGGMEEVLIVLNGVHEPIPAVKTISQPVAILPPPPQDKNAPKQTDQTTGVKTDADKLLQRYQTIENAEGLHYGVSGSKIPDFNAKVSSPGAAPTAAGAGAATPPKPAAPAGATPAAGAPSAPKPANPAAPGPVAHTTPAVITTPDGIVKLVNPKPKAGAAPADRPAAPKPPRAVPSPDDRIQ